MTARSREFANQHPPGGLDRVMAGPMPFLPPPDPIRARRQQIAEQRLDQVSDIDELEAEMERQERKAEIEERREDLRDRRERRRRTAARQDDGGMGGFMPLFQAMMADQRRQTDMLMQQFQSMQGSRADDAMAQLARGLEEQGRQLRDIAEGRLGRADLQREPEDLVIGVLGKHRELEESLKALLPPQTEGLSHSEALRKAALDADIAERAEERRHQREREDRDVAERAADRELRRDQMNSFLGTTEKYVPEIIAGFAPAIAEKMGLGGRRGPDQAAARQVPAIPPGMRRWRCDPDGGCGQINVGPSSELVQTCSHCGTSCELDPLEPEEAEVATAPPPHRHPAMIPQRPPDMPGPPPFAGPIEQSGPFGPSIGPFEPEEEDPNDGWAG